MNRDDNRLCAWSGLILIVMKLCPKRKEIRRWFLKISGLYECAGSNTVCYTVLSIVTATSQILLCMVDSGYLNALNIQV